MLRVVELMYVSDVLCKSDYVWHSWPIGKFSSHRNSGPSRTASSRYRKLGLGLLGLLGISFFM